MTLKFDDKFYQKLSKRFTRKKEKKKTFSYTNQSIRQMQLKFANTNVSRRKM